MKEFKQSEAVKIRLAEKQDTPKLLHMIKALAAFNDDISQATAETLERDIWAENPILTVFVAEADTGLVGYAAVCERVALHFGRRGMDIHHLFVAEGYRHMGLGRRLIETCKSHAIECGSDYLLVSTRDENDRAKAAYIACGFELRRGRPAHFGMPLK
ncbi:GNAT family N-acetyltransferase [Pseudaestuariivita rosea]|uniref:GNAT family N-acetyltransferase n=1 Tax=Pseudaestuariivita rosea TaxID=2763263 RepID=UPI001ABBA2BA|nr:GNAT family N-acetyltransferase [Pseudaestuariivita rosea]